MTKKVKSIPDGFRTLTPYLTIKDAANAIKFYHDAFGAKEIEVNHSPDGKVMHALLQIGDSYLMFSDEFPEYGGVLSPTTLKGTTFNLFMYVEDADAAFKKAINAGAKVKMPLENMFWGDRFGQLEDPFGHIWSIATHIADVDHDHMNDVADECCKKH